MTDQREFDRLLAAFFVEGTDEVADRVIDAALDHIEHIPQRRALRAPWRLLTMNRYAQLAAGVAMVAVVATSAIMLNGRAGPAGVPGASPTAGSASPTDTPRPTSSPSVAPTAAPWVGLAWKQVSDPDLASSLPHGSIDGVIAGGPGAIAWGSIYGAGPRIWTTTDGLDWKSASVEAVPDANPDQKDPGSVADVTPGGPGYVAVGEYQRKGTSGNTAVAWTSTDGVTWQRVADDPSFANALMSGVISWRGELFAYGAEAPGLEGGPQRVWASNDGLHWNVIDLTLPSGVTAIGLPVVASDRLWASTTGSYLTSTDGRTWVASALPVIGASYGLGTLYPLADALYATVAPWPLPAPQFTPPPKPAEQPAPGVYRSTDLATWTPRSVGLTTVGNDLIAVGDTMIMVGDNATCPSANCVATGWRSLDGGVTWQVAPADKVAGVMRSVAALPDGTLVAVGQTYDEQISPHTAAWVSPPVRP